MPYGCADIARGGVDCAICAGIGIGSGGAPGNNTLPTIFDTVGCGGSTGGSGPCIETVTTVAGCNCGFGTYGSAMLPHITAKYRNAVLRMTNAAINNQNFASGVSDAFHIAHHHDASA